MVGFDCYWWVFVWLPQCQWWHDDVIKWKHFPRNWLFVRGIHRSTVNSQHKGQWRGALMFSLICVWINRWVNNREAGDLRWYRAHYDVIVMEAPNDMGKSIITSLHKTQQAHIVCVLPRMHCPYCQGWWHWDAFDTGCWKESIEHLHHRPGNCIIALLPGNDSTCCYPYEEFNQRWR